MREILFRGKRITTGEWVYGNLLITGEVALIGKTMKTLERVDPATVGQYTSMTDKNGNKIFEGDIFEFDDEVWESSYTSCGTEYNSWDVKNKGSVGFCEYEGRFDFVRYKHYENSVEADLHENHCLEFYEFIRELEVIGNIHDNPELLEV